MSRESTLRAGVEDLAQGFAEHVRTWSLRLGATEAAAACAAQAARAVSLATSSGHVCTTLRELADAATDAGIANLRDQLIASRVTGTPAAPGTCPLVLDDEGRLYLHRYFDYERRLARRLAQFASLATRHVGRAARDRLATLFQRDPGETRANWQQVAAALALRQGLTIISGGPGTGKTTTVVNLLACVLEQEPATRIALAAPTGKAAARLVDAIRARSASLPASLRQRMPAEASTVHRLLGFSPGGGFARDASNPLPVDLLVVDEASMLDLALATRLLEAVPRSGRVVLLGDKDQLAAVESGAVFAELSANPALGTACRSDLESLCGLTPWSLEPPSAAHAGGLRDTTVWLTRNHRFVQGSSIGRLAAAIRDGHEGEAVALLGSPPDASLQWHRPQPHSRVVDVVAQRYAPFLAAVRRDPTDVAAVAQAFGRFRVLCALRAGDEGVAAINGALRALAAAQAPGDGDATWYAGRPVMVQVNDYALKLFNGDIGIALPDAQGRIAVFFADGQGGWRSVAPARMPAHDDAYAMTVHKSQGSEFDDVLVVLPSRPAPVLTRELLYTGVTRARAGVALWGSEAVLRATTVARTDRASGLLARIAEQPPGAPHPAI